MYILVATGVVKGIRVYGNRLVFKIGGILDIEFLYFTILKNGNAGLHILRNANMSP